MHDALDVRMQRHRQAVSKYHRAPLVQSKEVKLIQDIHIGATKKLNVFRGIKKISSGQDTIDVIIAPCKKSKKPIITESDLHTIISTFIRENVDVTGSNEDRVFSKQVYNAFKLEHVVIKMDLKAFNKRMQNCGHTAYESRSRDAFRDKVVFEGLKWKENENRIIDAPST